MTYTLFEWAKENVVDLMSGQPAQLAIDDVTTSLKDVEINKVPNIIDVSFMSKNRLRLHQTLSYTDERAESNFDIKL